MSYKAKSCWAVFRHSKEMCIRSVCQLIFLHVYFLFFLRLSSFFFFLTSSENLDIITTTWTLRPRISTTSNRVRCPYQNLLGIISVFISRSRKSRIPLIFTGTPFPRLFFLLWPFHSQLLSPQSLPTPPIWMLSRQTRWSASRSFPTATSRKSRYLVSIIPICSNGWHHVDRAPLSQPNSLATASPWITRMRIQL